MIKRTDYGFAAAYGSENNNSAGPLKCADAAAYGSKQAPPRPLFTRREQDSASQRSG